MTAVNQTDDMTCSRRRRPWRRKLFVAVIALATWGLCELTSWAYLSWGGRGLDDVRADQQSLADSASRQGKLGETIHPYVGWVLNPDLHAGADAPKSRLGVNRWGFFGNTDVIPKRSPDRVVIGIAGGSVAWQMTRDAEDELVSVLQQDRRFAGKTIHIVCLAMQGYKQPQQLMALAYLLTLGFEFDAIINLDGYNEVALAICENHDAGVALSYPRSWHTRMQDVVDPREYAVSQRLLEIRGQRQRLARNMQASPLRWSALRNLIWRSRDTRLQQELVELSVGMKDRRTRQGRGFAADGPVDDELQGEAMEKQVVSLWERSSRQLAHLCEGNDIRYLHCLQPNQYLEGSKPLSDQERRDFIEPDQLQGEQINRLYPSLIAVGTSLREEGIAFYDLTRVFHDVHETVYADNVCHLNDLGNDLLAKAVAARLLESW